LQTKSPIKKKKIVTKKITNQLEDATEPQEQVTNLQVQTTVPPEEVQGTTSEIKEPVVATLVSLSEETTGAPTVEQTVPTVGSTQVSKAETQAEQTNQSSTIQDTTVFKEIANSTTTSSSEKTTTTSTSTSTSTTSTSTTTTTTTTTSPVLLIYFNNKLNLLFVSYFQPCVTPSCNNFAEGLKVIVM